MKMLVQTHELKLTMEGKDKDVARFLDDLEKIQYIVKSSRILEEGDNVLTVVKGIEAGEITVDDLKDMEVIDVVKNDAAHLFRIIVKIRGKEYEWIFVVV